MDLCDPGSLHIYNIRVKMLKRSLISIIPRQPCDTEANPNPIKPEKVLIKYQSLYRQ